MDEEKQTEVEVIQPNELALFDQHRFEIALTRLKAQAEEYFATRLSDAKQTALTAGVLDVHDNDSYEQAGRLRSRAATDKRDLDKSTKPLRERADQVKAIVMDKQKEIIGHYDAAIKILDPLLSAWEEKKRKEAEAEARKKEAAERKRLEKEREAQAKTMLQHGNEEAAEEILSQPIIPPAHRPVADIPKVAGQSARKVYKGRVVNLMALVKAVAVGKAPLYFLEVAESKINSAINDQKGVCSYPGIEIYSEDVRTSR